MHVLAETAAMTPTSKFSTRELRGLFDLQSELERKRATRRGLWIAVGAYLAYSMTDCLFIADVARSTIIGHCRYQCSMHSRTFASPQSESKHNRRGLSYFRLDRLSRVAHHSADDCGPSRIFILYGLRRDLHDERQSFFPISIQRSSCLVGG